MSLSTTTMPTQTNHIPPKTNATRPLLPVTHANNLIKFIDASKLPSVKFQELEKEGQKVIIGRLKIPTPGGHAFILRRYDTGAISLTTMYRAAFPSATEDQEKAEVHWVKTNYDGTASSKDPYRVRLAGTWISVPVALTLADAYSISHIIPPLADAQPDPVVQYRRSGKPSPQTQAVASTALPTPANSFASSNPPKRRREASPAPSVDSAPPQSPPSQPVLRRSTRKSSPVAPPVFYTTMTPLKAKVTKSTTVSAKVTRSAAKRQEPLTPAASDETAVDDDIPDIAGPDMSEDIAEQKELIEKLKQERAKAREEGAGSTTEATDAVSKRARDEGEEQMQFNFKEPENEERAIATNKRVGGIYRNLPPEQKSAAWGLAAFAFGLGAMTYLPNPFF